MVTPSSDVADEGQERERYIRHRLTRLGNAALDRRDALMRRERSPTTRIPSLLTRMRRRQLVCASVGGLIKTTSPPLDLMVLMSKIESLSMTTIQSTSVT
jgi:hypothetical protein